MLPLYNRFKPNHTLPTTANTRSIVVATCSPSTQHKTGTTKRQAGRIWRSKVVSPQWNTKKVSQTAPLCSVWSSSSGVNSNARGIISLNQSNLTRTKRRPSQESRCPRSPQSRLKMSQTCLSQPNRTNHKSQPKQELRLRIMPRWRPRRMLSDARTSRAPLLRRAACDWLRSPRQTVEKAVKMLTTKW